MMIYAHYLQEKTTVMKWIDLINANIEEWLILMIEIEGEKFNNNFSTPSKFYKNLSNSKCSIGGITNREYFKMNVKGGFYSVMEEQGHMKLLLCLEGGKIHPLQLNVRIRKLLPQSSVRILKLEELSDWDFIHTKNQLVGQHYFNLQNLF